MSGKQDLQKILVGQIPDQPPHWELVFQIEKEMWGMDEEAVPEPDRWSFRLDVYRRVVDEFGWAAVPAGYDAELVRQYKKALGGKALIAGFEGSGVFWLPGGDEMMDFAVRMYERPNELHAEARQKCEAAKALLHAEADAGADFFVLTYDFGFNTQPFISPAHFREFVAPYLTEIVETAHDLGKRAVLHSDGCINLILDQIHATGVDGYQSVDPQGQMNIRAVRDQYPDWILMGNVACNMLQDVNEQEIRAFVRYCMEHGGIGKPYVFSTSNCIFKGMPPESYRIMHDEYRRLCTSHAGALS